ncbi:MAG: WYL domain-containing protein [Gemmatimonadales bacterium]
MADIAQDQIQRIVDLVAWMSQRDSQQPVAYTQAGRALGVSPATVEQDLKVLLDLTDRYKPWLGSLGVLLTARGFAIESRGAFRRPMRLSRDEALALVVGLTGVRGGKSLAEKLGNDFGAAPEPEEVESKWAVGSRPRGRVAEVLALAREARDERKKLEISYCASDGESTDRVVHVHQVVQAGPVWYLVAWCESAQGTRHFRAERILSAALLEEEFSPRSELRRVKSRDHLVQADGPVPVVVVFEREIVRWMQEKYPGGETLPDGRYQVIFPMADPHWLVREVLQYGAAAEVVSPSSIRELIARTV